MDLIRARLSTPDERVLGPKGAHRRLSQLLDRMEPSDSITTIMKLSVAGARLSIGCPCPEVARLRELDLIRPVERTCS